MTEKAGLARVLSPAEVLLLTLSALSPVVSVFIGGNGILHLAGTGAAIAFILGGVFNSLFATLYAEIAAAFPGAGGVYPALTRLLGPRWTYAYVILTVPSSFFTVSFSGLGLAAYLHTLAPATPVFGLTVAGIAIAGMIAALGIRSNAMITGVFLGVELVALAVLVVTALMHQTNPVGTVLFHPVRAAGGSLAATSGAELALAAVAGVWVSGGASWALFFAEEMRDAQRRIGRVVAWVGTIASLTIAVPLVLVVLAIDDLPAVLASPTPIAAFLDRSAGPLVGTIVTCGVALAIFNALIAAIMGQARFLFAVGRDGVLPGPLNRLLASLHPRFRSPIGATLTLVIVACAIALLGERWVLIIISGNVSDYILIALAVWIGRRTGLTGRFFAAPFNPLIPLVGLAFGAAAVVADWVDTDAGRPSVVLLSGVFAAAAAFYGWRRRQVGHDIVLSGSDGELD